MLHEFLQKSDITAPCSRSTKKKKKDGATVGRRFVRFENEVLGRSRSFDGVGGHTDSSDTRSQRYLRGYID